MRIANQYLMKKLSRLAVVQCLTYDLIVNLYYVHY
jgi:hypothetical protein